MDAPAGYKRLPDGARCRCINLWADSALNYWCCNLSTPDSPVIMDMDAQTPQPKGPELKWQGPVLLPGETVQYLADLAKTGVWGSTIDAVVESLIAEGIRRAIDDGHIKIRTFDSAESR